MPTDVPLMDVNYAAGTRGHRGDVPLGWIGRIMLGELLVPDVGTERSSGQKAFCRRCAGDYQRARDSQAVSTAFTFTAGAGAHRGRAVARSIAMSAVLLLAACGQDATEKAQDHVDFPRFG